MPTTTQLGLRYPSGTSAADVVTDLTNLATDVDNALGLLPNPPICQLRQVGAQGFASGVTTIFTWDTEDVDNVGMHSPSVNPTRITAVRAGRYKLSGGVSWLSNATGIRSADWTVNGVQVNGGSTTVNAVNGFSTRIAVRSISVFLNIGDYVEIIGFQNSGVSLNTATSGNEQSLIVVEYIGAS